MYNSEQIESKFNTVLSRIEEGMSVRSILPKGNSIVGITEFYSWLDEDEDKKKRYARACEVRAEKIFEEILDIADDATKDEIITESGGKIENKEFVSRSRLKIDARKWVLSKMNPTKYGDRTVIAGDKDAPLEVITGMKIT